jgi:hypothetical protein
MHEDDVEADTDGTLAYKWVKNENGFREKFCSIDNCAGVYGVSFTKKGMAESLTGVEWGDLRDIART